tara:strand:+ start:2081 stop:3094 length:1014 start_codon:yes stop_codon:yes gene_type:complete
MMMNDFGTPMNDVEMNMAPLGARRIVDRIKAESGIESQVIGSIIKAGISLVGGIWGANEQKEAAKEQAKILNENADRQFAYDTEVWEMKKLQLEKDHLQAILELETKAGNELKQKEYQDAILAERYNYDLQIREREQESLNAQFERSDEIFNLQIGYNELAEKAAREDERYALEETLAKSRFDDEEIRLQALMDQGAMHAKGLSGVSADKASNAVWAKAGKRLAALNASTVAAGRTSRSVLNEISRDRDTADLAAFASRMLDPGELPMPIAPTPTPLTDWVMPPALEEFDFGPAPVHGAQYSVSAAAQRAWGSSIPSIAASAGSFVSGLGQQFKLFD